MSRGGVTELEVKQAKEALEERGVNPSVEKLRDELGGGSPNTILRHMRAIRSKEAGLFGELGAVSQELSGLVLKLHNTLHAEAKEIVNAAVAKAKADFDNKVLALAGEKEALNTQLSVERSAKEDLQSRLKTADTQIEDLTTKFGNANSEIARLAEALTHATNDVKLREEALFKAERSVLHEREGRAHYEAAVKLERERLQEQHNRATLEAQQSYREQESRITEMFEQSSDLTRKVAVLQAEIGARDRTIAELQGAITKGLERLEAQENKTDEMRIEVATHSARSSMLHQQNEEMTARNESKSAELAMATAEIAQLKSHLADATAELATAKAKPDLPIDESTGAAEGGKEVKS